MGTRYITKFDPPPPKTEGKDMGTESHPPDGIPDPPPRPKGVVGPEPRRPSKYAQDVMGRGEKPDPPPPPSPKSRDGGSEVLPQAGPGTKNPWEGLAEAMCEKAARACHVTPEELIAMLQHLQTLLQTQSEEADPRVGRSRILPRQDDELPSIWDLYMAAALGKLAEKFPAGWTLQERQACIAAVNQWAAEYADDAILERKIREGGT